MVRSLVGDEAMRSRRDWQIAAVLLLIAAIAFAPVVLAEEEVAFNVETKKYHCLECRWAVACTKNCVVVTLGEAKRRGGIACKVCGGKCA